MVSLYVVIFASDSTGQIWMPSCILSMLMYAVVDMLFFWPVFLRLCYIQKVGTIVRSFYANSNEELAKTNRRKCAIVIFIFLIGITGYKLVYFVFLLISPKYRPQYCSCVFSVDFLLIFSAIFQEVSLLAQVVSFAYYSCTLCSGRQMKLKYKIRLQLLILCICWVILIINGFIYDSRFDCNILIFDYIFYPETYINYAVELTMFTFLTIFPICANRNAQKQPDISSLILDFPQALYFWVPNYHFNLYLRNNYPQAANYRPFIADILRYDFQIEEIHSRANESQNSQFQHLNGVDNKGSEVLSLALYMRDRYLVEESKGYCEFKDQPEVLQNIKEKYGNIEENLDEFLFEFVRPYIENRLSPLYSKFIESEDFKNMIQQLRAAEMFEWVLSMRQK